MTLQTLLIYIAIAAIILTVLIGLLKKGHKSWLMTFLQNFTGVLFIVSGMVKAVDPLGTAYKMEQYFAEFQYTFAETSASFLSPLFPFLSSISIWFSVFMIVFEILLGLMLVLGHKPKLTSWLFLLLVVFFTALTGFTYLTGYVPSDANFFKFAS
ncbi:MAG TPA: MauE/DoxX family redox-associated membrane protein, partial [Saprospiraceae bacterium]|nr:MauE/DoxX family redox-associated membrane protein [Saprospiraceae bacterium]